jgi:hypothetical protein
LPLNNGKIIDRACNFTAELELTGIFFARAALGAGKRGILYTTYLMASSLKTLAMIIGKAK